MTQADLFWPEHPKTVTVFDCVQDPPTGRTHRCGFRDGRFSTGALALVNEWGVQVCAVKYFGWKGRRGLMLSSRVEDKPNGV